MIRGHSVPREAPQRSQYSIGGYWLYFEEAVRLKQIRRDASTVDDRSLIPDCEKALDASNKQTSKKMGTPRTPQ